MRTDPYATLHDPPLVALLRQHHRRANWQLPRLWWHLLPTLPRLVLGRSASLDRPGLKAAEDRSYLAIQPDQGAFLHGMVLATQAECVVEFGTSFGVSTMWMAAALRELGRGRVVTTEIVPEKAEQARKNLEEADLLPWVDLRVGDATHTLSDLEGPVDLFFSDGSSALALALLQQLTPKLRSGALVITDNVGTMPANYATYLAWLADPENGYSSFTVPYKLGTQVSVKR